MNQTTAEKTADRRYAQQVLNTYSTHLKTDNALLLISQDFGKGLTDYLRITLVYTDEKGKTQTANLTWAIGKAYGYPVKSRNGYNYVAISGYGYSKPDEIARSLARLVDVDRVRYEIA